MKLNKKGQAIFAIPNGILLAFVICNSIGWYHYSRGEWGKDGTDNLKARQQKIINDGGHINTSPARRQTFDYYVQP